MQPTSRSGSFSPSGNRTNPPQVSGTEITKEPKSILFEVTIKDENMNSCTFSGLYQGHTDENNNPKGHGIFSGKDSNNNIKFNTEGYFNNNAS